MNVKDKILLIVGAVYLATAIILKMTTTITVVQTSVILAVGFIIVTHSFGYMKRAINDRDEFFRRVNQNSMARSWRATQYLVMALLFASVLRWITLSAVWMLIIVSVFMTLSYVLFMIPLFQKGDVE